MIDNNFTNLIDKVDDKNQMDVTPTIDEVSNSIDRLNLGKSPGIDGIASELLRFGGDSIRKSVHSIIKEFWDNESVHADWRNALMVVLYKGKGPKNECGNYRGIALLSCVGKVLSRILLDRLLSFISNDVLQESQCGFRKNRGTTDMIFSARQLQEKCREQNLGLYQVFVDLTKAFDTVNRKALWEILHKLGCPNKFVNILKSFHDDMNVWVNVSGNLSDPITVDNGVKQGDIPAPTLFAIYFAIVFNIAFRESTINNVFIRYRYSGKLFNIRRLACKTKVMVSLLRDFLYADDCDLVAHTEHDMQVTLNCFSKACTMLGLTISLKKTVVLYQPAPGVAYIEPSIFVYGEKLKAVDNFVYLGSTLDKSCKLNAEINLRISKASASFGKLEKRCWSRRAITMETKLNVYKTCVVLNPFVCL